MKKYVLTVLGATILCSATFAATVEYTLTLKGIEPHDVPKLDLVISEDLVRPVTLADLGKEQTFDIPDKNYRRTVTFNAYGTGIGTAVCQYKGYRDPIEGLLFEKGGVLKLDLQVSMEMGKVKLWCEGEH